MKITAARCPLLRRRAVLPTLFFCTFAASAYAGSFRLTPMLIEVPPGSRIATYTVRNTGAQPLSLEVDAVRWKQAANDDRFTAAKRLLVIPAIMTVPPGREQLVRVALRGKRPAGELEYRLHFNEIPSLAAKPKHAVQIRTLLNMNVPLFFAPRVTVKRYEPRLSLAATDTAAIVAITNTGSRFLRLSKLVLKDTAGQVLGKLNGPLYVLPGAIRQWTIRSTAGRLSKSTQYRLEAVSDGREKGYSLTLR